MQGFPLTLRQTFDFLQKEKLSPGEQLRRLIICGQPGLEHDMTDVVQLDAYRGGTCDEGFVIERKSLADDLFLIEEGLDLLAAYKEINDKTVRLNILALVRSLGRKPTPATAEAPVRE